jgi:hypothetical protein
MANTTPLVLEQTFLSLGREPRQFDAFYLGSAEAFSKKGAEVQLCFEIADPSFATFSRVRGGLWGNTLAGVGADRKLHLLQFDANTRELEKFRDREPLQPPVPGFNGQADASTPVPLDAKPPWRLPMWNEGLDFLVASSAGGNVWLWHEKLFDFNNSGWIPFDEAPASTATCIARREALHAQPAARHRAVDRHPDVRCERPHRHDRPRVDRSRARRQRLRPARHVGGGRHGRHHRRESVVQRLDGRRTRRSSAMRRSRTTPACSRRWKC